MTTEIAPDPSLATPTPAATPADANPNPEVAVTKADTPADANPNPKVAETKADTPEPYELRAPEGADAAVFDAVKAAALAGKVPATAAQAIVDAAHKQQQDAITAQQKSWRDAAIADQEIGGARLHATTENAKQIVEAFGSPALAEFLSATKLNEHPEFLRMFAKVHGAVSPDRLVGGRKSGVTAARDMSFASIANRMYPQS